MTSILNTIKKMLGADADYTAFDTDIIVLINGALMKLFQLGVGPIDNAFLITGSDETWEDFLGESTDFEGAKEYIYLSTKIIFDPPTSSYVLDAMKNEIEELGWRLAAQAETK